MQASLFQALVRARARARERMLERARERASTRAHVNERACTHKRESLRRGRRWHQRDTLVSVKPQHRRVCEEGDARQNDELALAHTELDRESKGGRFRHRGRVHEKAERELGDREIDTEREVPCSN
jgi:hypothetical protein